VALAMIASPQIGRYEQPIEALLPGYHHHHRTLGTATAAVIGEMSGGVKNVVISVRLYRHRCSIRIGAAWRGGIVNIRDKLDWMVSCARSR
jgi:hypothetical protein